MGLADRLAQFGGDGHPKHHGRFNPRDRARYVVEVMGFKDPGYERGSVAKSGWLVTCLRDLERGVEA